MPLEESMKKIYYPLFLFLAALTVPNFALRAEENIDSERIDELVRQLDDSQYRKRERASIELLGIGYQAALYLREVRARTTSLEVQRRLNQILLRYHFPDSTYLAKMRFESALRFTRRIQVPILERRLGAVSFQAGQVRWVAKFDHSQPYCLAYLNRNLFPGTNAHLTIEPGTYSVNIYAQDRSSSAIVENGYNQVQKDCSRIHISFSQASAPIFCLDCVKLPDSCSMTVSDLESTLGNGILVGGAR